MSGGKLGRIVTLDLLRVVACFAVLVFHFAARGYDIGAPSYGEIRAYAAYGFMGVSLFFIISGFVIFTSMEKRSLGGFARARWLRIYPTFVICMTLTALLSVCLDPPSDVVTLRRWTTNLTMISPVFGESFVDGVYWSIIVEVIFYVLIAVLGAVGLIPEFTESVVAVWLVLAALNETLVHSRLASALLLTAYAPLFATGMLAALLVADRPSLRIYSLLALAGFLALLFSQHDVQWFSEHTTIIVTYPGLIACYVAIFALFALAILARRMIAASQMLIILGGLTYPTYLVHQHIGYLGLQRLSPLLGRWPALLIVTAGCVALAWLVYAHLEPGLRRLLAWVGRRTDGVFAAAVRTGLQRISWAPYAPFPEPAMPGEATLSLSMYETRSGEADSLGAPSSRMRVLVRQLRRQARRNGRKYIGRFPNAMIVVMYLYNLWWEFRISTGRYKTDFNALVREFDAREACDYIERCFDSFEAYTGAKPTSGRLLELGPGGSAGVALLARAAGCESVDLVDRFVVSADVARMSLVYDELARRHAIEAFREGEQWDRFRLSGIRWFEGEPAENFLSRRAAGTERYTWIVSTTVLQHLYDPLAALRDMVACLEPGGRMVHLVDLSDQGFFSQHNHDLTWLTVPTALWPALTRASGAPNRVLLHQYERVLEDLVAAGKIRYEIRTTRLIGGRRLVSPTRWGDEEDSAWQPALDDVEAIRPKLAAEFQDLSSRYLATNEFVFVVQRS